MSPRLLIVCGTRPEIIKLSPIIRELAKRKYPFDIFFTNQHHLPLMGWDFFKQLGLLSIKKPILLRGQFNPSTCLAQLSELLPKYAGVMVHGDTNSAFLGALAARWHRRKVFHVEAGLRSFNPLMIEEENRIMIDVISDILFVPLAYQLKNVWNCYGIKHVVGNPIADVVDHNKGRIGTRPLLSKYLFMTLHRPELVDHPEKLQAALKAVSRAVAARYPQASIIFPVHPRTITMLSRLNVRLESLIPQAVVIQPLNMINAWTYIKHAEALITDSGGLQEEAAILGTPCFTLRDDTERGELVKLGCNVLLSLHPAHIEKRIKKAVFKKKWRHPYGKNVSKKIVTQVAAALEAPSID